MNMDTKGPGFTAKVALFLAVFGLGGAAGATVLNVGRATPEVATPAAYPKISKSMLNARRASSGGGGGYYRSTRYGRSSRSYGGGGYSGGK
jgi:hypothetical protein